MTLCLNTSRQMVDLFANEASVSILCICKGLFQVLYFTLYPLLAFFYLQWAPKMCVLGLRKAELSTRTFCIFILEKICLLISMSKISEKCFPFTVQSLNYVQLFVTSQTAVCQASLSFTISPSLLKLMSIELVMPSNHLILCYPPLL